MRVLGSGISPNTMTNFIYYCNKNVMNMWNLNHAYAQNSDTFNNRNNLKQTIITTYLAIQAYKNYPSRNACKLNFY